jgi:type I restriction enzyme S subunit
MTTAGEWIGTVPNEWSVAPLKSIVSFNTETLPESTDPDYQFDYVEISDVTAEGGIAGRSAVTFGDAPSRARRIARRGDVLVSTVRTYLRAVAPLDADSELVVSTGFAVLRATESVEENFLKYICLSEPFLASTIARSTGVSYPAINASDLVRIRVPVPPIGLQRKIGQFLDRETAKIDALIAKQEQLIATLREDRTATITHAVTKGLDAGVEMRESGVRWIGTCPSHWAVSAVKHRARIFVPDRDKPDLEENGDLPWITADLLGERSPKPSKHFVNRRNIGQRSIRTAPAGMVLAVCVQSLGLASILSEEAVVNQQVQGYLPRQELDRSYLWYLIQSAVGYFESVATSTTMPYVNQHGFANLQITLPPLPEQDQIVSFLDIQTAKVASLTSRVEGGIATLREYRSALITDAVSGKIDVRGVA